MPQNLGATCYANAYLQVSILLRILDVLVQIPLRYGSEILRFEMVSINVNRLNTQIINSKLVASSYIKCTDVV